MREVRRLPRKTVAVLLVLSIALAACLPDELAQPTATEPSVPPRATEAPPATLAPSEIPPTPTPLQGPTITPFPEPTADDPSEKPALAILSFSAVAEDSPAGKRLLFAWETTGASVVRIVSGTSQRFAPWWEVEPTGKLVVELTTTNYPDPTMALMAFDEDGNQVLESAKVDWPCQYDYFFEPAPIACPAGRTEYPEAAEQAFQGGRALWLAKAGGLGVSGEHVILVLYDDYQWQSHDDTWGPEEPESDAEIVPPDGLYQPARGFGKLWRQGESIREKLGWALGSEEGFRSAWQWQVQESLPAVAYVRTIGGDVLKLYGSGSGNWEFVTP